MYYYPKRPPKWCISDPQSFPLQVYRNRHLAFCVTDKQPVPYRGRLQIRQRQTSIKYGLNTNAISGSFHRETNRGRSSDESVGNSPAVVQQIQKDTRQHHHRLLLCFFYTDSWRHHCGLSATGQGRHPTCEEGLQQSLDSMAALSWSALKERNGCCVPEHDASQQTVDENTRI